MIAYLPHYDNPIHNTGQRKVGEQVNLERAMGAHIRFGGHFVQVKPSSRCMPSLLIHAIVQAHVDATANLIQRSPDGDSLRLLFRLPEATPDRPSLLHYIIPKGYVTIDGASLTVTSVDDEERTFGVMLIQHTQEKITLARKAIDAKVNIEVDMVGKYVEKSVLAALSGGGGQAMQALVEKVVVDVLAKKGIK